MPVVVELELATLVAEAPTGDEWIHEIKFDGYRGYCRVDGGKAAFTSRNQNDWTGHFRGLADAASRLPVRQAILDGEVVVVQPDGKTSFQALQNALNTRPPRDLTYMVFDLLYLDGFDLRGAVLDDRKRLLRELIGEGAGPIRYVDHVEGHGGEFYSQACSLALEGAMSKRRDRPYRAGRGRDWQKVKCLQRQEFVVVGFTEPGGGRTGLGALLLGVRDSGALRFAGRVGTGFTEKVLRDLRARLEPLEQPKPAVEGAPEGGPAKGMHWVRPQLVAEVVFTEWTADGQLRHPSFQGLREDKPVEEVVVERPAPAEREVPAAKTESARARRGVAERAEEPAKKPADAPRKKAGEPVRIDSVTLTNPERVLWPDIGLTKRELLEYYDRIAEWIEPFVVNRPLTLVRCPSGYTGQCFYQKHWDEKFGRFVHSVPIREEAATQQYITVPGMEGFLTLAQMGTLEFHPWGARSDDPEKPDRMIFDLDPDPDLPFSRLVDTARLLRERLRALGLVSFVKTTGGKGLHVVVPIRRTIGWDDLKSFSKGVVDGLVALAPSLYTANMSKAQRSGKIYIDYLRNSRGATAIASYSARARPGAPVSVPLTWEELDDVRPDGFHVRDVPARLDRLRGDPWAEYTRVRQQVTAEARREVASG